MRKFLLALTMTTLLAPAARADVMEAPLSYVGNQLDAVGETLGGLWSALSPKPKLARPDPVPAAPRPALLISPTPLAPRAIAEVHLAPDVRLPQVPAAAPLPEPTFEKAAKKLFCVEYARAISGLNIFGDAKLWWARAKNLYDRASHPIEDAVMVFSGSSRLRRGHLAVVSEVVSPREIRVEQANWLNKGEIDHSTPVLDVSANNDWSKVRVWDMPSKQFGSRVYAISGFILKPLIRQARAD
jgi:hypothetical protein